jgi:hypothetical protein
MTDEVKIDISEDVATLELTYNEITGLLNALNEPEKTPATVLVGYINRIAAQAEPQAKQLIATKQAIKAANE